MTRARTLRHLRRAIGACVLVVAVGYLLRVGDGATVRRVALALFADPLGLAAALAAYAAAFWLRAAAWRRVLPALPVGQAWAALHVSLLGNHVLPLRMGEPLRPLSVVRRTSLPVGPVTASTVTLRGADLLAVLALALVAAPGLLLDVAGPVGVAAASVALLGVVVGGLAWSRRHPDTLRLPGTAAAAATLGAWVLESAVVWQVAHAAGVAITTHDAVAVTAVTIAAQALAVTPGGFGSYEAAAAAALVAGGADPATAFAVALTTHAVKTGYSVVTGLVALVAPAPTFWGHLRLPRRVPPQPAPCRAAAGSPVVVMMPVYDEAARVGDVVRRVPATSHGHPVEVIVVDDGSTDGSAAVAARAGARVVRHPGNLGLGAAVRRGLAEASTREPAAVVYLDADGEYFPEDVDRVVAPVLAGEADYVVGSRFAGDIRRMLPQRRVGNLVLTAWVRWLTRCRGLTDGQSGFRAFSPAAAADGEIVHDYNYAQVLTLDLLAKGYRYAEVPITYTFRESGTSFVRLGRYLRRVVPAVHRELNVAGRPQSSTTWAANRSRAAAHAVASSEPSERSALTAS